MSESKFKMKTLRLVIILLVLLFSRKYYAQLDFKVSANKENYNYGDIIYLTCTVSNNSDSTIKILVYNFSSCQAEFAFDNFQSILWTRCLPASEEIVFSPKSSRKYNWTIDPKRFGLPNKDGSHKIIGNFGYHLPPYSTSDITKLLDTLYITAPMFLGGQLKVGFQKLNDTIVTQLKDSLSVEVLHRDEFPWGISEIWQILGIPIDSLFDKLGKDYRLNYVEYNRQIQYDSISTITSVEHINPITNKYYLSDAYPNPCNPTSKFYLEIPKTCDVSIELYNILGEKVSTIYKGILNGNIRYNFEINSMSLSSGVYYYTVRSSSYQKTKKIILLK